MKKTRWLVSLELIDDYAGGPEEYPSAKAVKNDIKQFGIEGAGGLILHKIQVVRKP